MEYIYESLLCIFFSITIYFWIRGMVIYPPSLHFIGRLEMARLSKDAQEILNEKNKVGTRYYIKMSVSLAIFIILLLLYPFIF